MLKNILMGCSGLIGTTLQEQFKFDYLYSSKNSYEIEKENLNGHNLWLSCLPATKWQVNQNLANDYNNISNIIKLLKNFRFNRIVLFSTIDVYEDSPKEVAEDFTPVIKKLSYGSNRYLFEIMVTGILKYDTLKIFRLPALYGKHIKKNILFDLLNNNQIENIRQKSKFQWYCLDDLYQDVSQRLNTNIKTYNLFPEPVYTKYIIDLFPIHKDRVDTLNQGSFYNFKTNYTSSKYLYSKEESLTRITKFIHETRSN